MIERINLLPEELRTVDKRPFYVVASLSLILYISFLYLVGNAQKADITMFQAIRYGLLQQTAFLSRQDAKHKEIIERIKVTEAKKKAIEARAGLVKKISDERIQWSDPMYELSTLVPEGLWLSGISSSDIMAGDKKSKRISVNGMALSSSLIANFMGALEASPYFEGVSLTYVQNAEFKGRQGFSFEAVFMVGGKK